MPWRPANITNLPTEAAHVINQLFRETNKRIDDTLQETRNHQRGYTVINTKGVQIGGGTLLSKAIQQSTSLNFGSVSPNSAKGVTLTVKGALAGKGTAFVSPQSDLGNANLTWSAWVSAPDTVEVRVANPTGGAITPNSVSWNVWVHQ